MSNMEGKKSSTLHFALVKAIKWVDDQYLNYLITKQLLFSHYQVHSRQLVHLHLPRYNELAPVFKQYGVDDILVVSVNDNVCDECVERS